MSTESKGKVPQHTLCQCICSNCGGGSGRRQIFKIVLGDFNAKFVKEKAFASVSGRRSKHEESSNNQDIFKGTWKIPGASETNQTDHVLVSKRWATDIRNVRTFRGANSDSDHILVGVNMKQRISTITKVKSKRAKRWNTDKLNEDQIE